MCNKRGAVSGNSNINVELSLDCSITIQFYVLIFACYYRLLPVFTAVLAKYFLLWQKPNLDNLDKD